MDESNELTTLRLKEKLLERFHASRRTIGRAHMELDWVHQTARYCQMVRDVNKVARLEQAKHMIKEGKKFDDVIYIDESTFQIEYHAIRTYMPETQTYW